MRTLTAIGLVLAAATSAAEIKFSPMNVRATEIVGGVTHSEFRTATNDLWTADAEKLPLAGGTMDDEAEITLRTEADTQGGRAVVKVTPLGIDIYELVRGTTLSYLASFGSDITLYGGNLTVRNHSGMLGGTETVYANGEIIRLASGMETARLTFPSRTGTLALTDDAPSYALCWSNNTVRTIDGTKTIGATDVGALPASGGDSGIGAEFRFYGNRKGENTPWVQISDAKVAVHDVASILSPSPLPFTELTPTGVLARLDKRGGSTLPRYQRFSFFTYDGVRIVDEEDSFDGKILLPNEEGTFATREYVSNKIIDHTSTRFSNEVLSVGLNLDPAVLAEVKTIADLFGTFPVEGTAMTLGGLLAALAVAIFWIRKTKQDQLFVFHPGGETRVLVPNGANKDVQKKFIADNPDFALSFESQGGDKWKVTASGYDTTKYRIADTYYMGPDPVANKKSLYVTLCDADDHVLAYMISAVGTISNVGDKVDLEPAEDSDALVTSGGVYRAIQNNPSMLYDPETDEYYQMIEK